MMNPFEVMIEKNGLEYKLERNNNLIGIIKAIIDNGLFMIDTNYSELPIQDDVIITKSGNYIVESSEYAGYESIYTVYTTSESKIKNIKSNGDVTFVTGDNSNINYGNNNSINSSVTFGDISKEIYDDEALNDTDKDELISILNEIKKDPRSMQKGQLHKFINFIESHPNISTFIASSLFQFLTQIP